MERHAKKFVERYCELAIQKTTVVQSLNSLPGRPSFQGGGTGNVWRLSKVCLQIVLIKVLFVTNLEDLTFMGLSTKLLEQSQNGEKLVTNA